MKAFITLMMVLVATSSFAATPSRYESFSCTVLKDSYLDKGTKFTLFQDVNPASFGQSLSNAQYFTLPQHSLLGEIRLGGFISDGENRYIPGKFIKYDLNVSVLLKINKAIGKIKRKFKAVLMTSDLETGESSQLEIKCKRK